MFIAAALVLVETCFELVIPILMADIIDVGVSAGDMALIGRRGIQMAVCALLALVTGLYTPVLRPGPPTVWGARVRQAQYAKVQAYSFANLDRFESSSLVTRMTTDITVLQNAINGGLRPMVRPGDADSGHWLFRVDEPAPGAGVFLLYAAVGGNSVLCGPPCGAHVQPTAEGDGPPQ